jgi:putative ATP-binding cassette transporter
LFRAIAGIWPGVTGSVSLPTNFDAEAMFLPQRAYFPQGRLRDALAYPEAAEHYSDEALRAALQAVLLPDLTGQLDESAAWNLRLSGGEQQRLAMARVLLKKPRWLFADEATSALDEATEATLYARLLETVAARDGAIVSIAHRASVKAFHTRQWVMQDVTHEGATQRRLVELG